MVGIVCVYDGTKTWAYICPTCKEYDGLMEINKAIKEYDFIAEMYADEIAFMPS
jgi:hypothetical protein